jgi:hypothetical protein
MKTAPPKWRRSVPPACPQDAIDAQKKRHRYGALRVLRHLRTVVGGRFCFLYRDFEISTAKKNT